MGNAIVACAVPEEAIGRSSIMVLDQRSFRTVPLDPRKLRGPDGRWRSTADILREYQSVG